MQLVSYLRDEQDQLAILVNGLLYNVDDLHPDLPGSMGMFLNYWEDAYPAAKMGGQAVNDKKFLQNRGIPYDAVDLLSPVPFPTSVRHVNAFSDGPPAKHPGFYFGNHHNIHGPGEIRCMPDHFAALDSEVQMAVVIAKPGRNIPAKEADQYIGGLVIMNNLVAGGPQKENFLTILGPALITIDELHPFEIPPREGHIGLSWNLPVKCSINGEITGQANPGEMHWTFAEIIERVSYGVSLYPGDVIGISSPGKGIMSKNNKTIQAGDIIEIEIAGLQKLSNTILPEDNDWSIV